MQHLIIIPGLGDRKWLYNLVRPAWAARGYRVHIFAFGWENDQVNFDEAQDKLNEYIRKLNESVFLIGASASGVAALNAFAANPTDIRKVVTIATPYSAAHRHQNRHLIRAHAELERNLPNIRKKTGRVISFHGHRDSVVAPETSQPNGLRHAALPMSSHGLIIASALTIFSGRIDAFFHE